MATAVVDIWNMAVSAISINKTINSENETSLVAEKCRLHYATVRDKVLRAAPWSSAKAYSRLALIKERNTSLAWATDDPEPGWRFAYRLPSDYLWPRFLSTYERFVMGTNGAENALMTNMESAILVYTKRQENVAAWDAMLVDAVANALAAMICRPLTGKNDRTQFVLQAANQAIMIARESAANEDFAGEEALPEWFTARGVAGPLNPNRFVYPVGPLLAFGGLNV